jgi:hypothetical protein
MLSRKERAEIDALSPEELEYELNLGDRSRYQREKIAYLKTRKTILSEKKAENEKASESTLQQHQFRLNSISTLVGIFLSIVGLVFGSGWYQEHQKNLRAEIEANERLIVEYLKPIATLLEDNEGLFRELRASPYSERGWGILESFLIKIRRDGVSTHALMRERIQRLVSNNDTIITLLNRYGAYTKTPQFQMEAAKFRDHAIRYSDRWKSLLEIYASNGVFPTAAPVFPDQFPAAVHAEIAARGANR